MIPDTQLKAWAEIQASLPEKRRRVFTLIASHPEGLALFEIADKLDVPSHWVSGRITELKEKHLIMDAGTRRINPESNKSAAVYIAKAPEKLF